MVPCRRENTSFCGLRSICVFCRFYNGKMCLLLLLKRSKWVNPPRFKSYANFRCSYSSNSHVFAYFSVCAHSAPKIAVCADFLFDFLFVFHFLSVFLLPPLRIPPLSIFSSLEDMFIFVQHNYKSWKSTRYF